MLTAQGFIRKRYADFITEMEEQARKLWGNDVNLSERGPLGLFIQNIAFARAEENEQAEQIYYSAYYFTAEGVSLDYTAKNRGMERNRAESAMGIVRFSVEPGISVNKGTIVATKDNIEFITTDFIRDEDGDGIIDIPIKALIPGTQGNVLPNTITEIITPAVGVNSVTNPMQTLYGNEEETDIEFRRRYANSFSTNSSTVEGIRTKLLNEVPGIRTAVVFENTDSSPDTYGRPPHSFEAVVYGGEDTEIVKALLEKKPAGIRSFGEKTFEIIDEAGNEHTIGFSRAEEIKVYVRVTVQRDGEFPAIVMGKKMIEKEVIKYIGGLDSSGVTYNGLSMGDTVVVGKITANIFSTIPGVKDCIVELSKDGVKWNSLNFKTDRLQVPTTDYRRVVIKID
ncbi:baseplate J/gp47 family protein [Bacillus sp. FSL W8-0519]|uniref:baseplate J/gp47 family protein n=1 Tax=Bacillus sp. FSL W8-0519 TaxID=2954624 RepID=UPI0030FA6689